jgi:hypothetical protein
MDETEKLTTSIFVKKLMHKVMMKSEHVVQGFIFFNHRIIVECDLDQPECEDLLKQMIINQTNVLKYLERKYIPTFVENGALFKDQKCIQKAMVQPDGTLVIHIAKSEPHKIITDTIHVRSLLINHGFNLSLHTKYYIDQVQIAYQDTLLYNLLLKEFGFQVPSPARQYERELLQKYGDLENVVKIKKRSVKRKFLRYYNKMGYITWKNLRQAIDIEDYSPRSVKLLSDAIRQEARDRGVDVKF